MSAIAEGDTPARSSLLTPRVLVPLALVGVYLIWGSTYLAIRTSSLAADSALLTLEQDTHATSIALDALVGNWPDTALAKNDQKHWSAKDARETR